MRNKNRIALKMLQLADKMDVQINKKINSAINGQNPTPRRTRIIAKMYNEGLVLLKIQSQLRALAQDHLTSTINPLLEKIRNKAQLETIHYHKSFPDIEDEQAYKRLIKAGITEDNFEQVKKTLSDLADIPKESPREVKIKKLENSLLGRKIDGFFATPRKLCTRVVELANIKENDLVLEPSAGKGNIAEEVRDKHRNKLIVIEPVLILREILELKNFVLVGYDFLDYRDKVDVIVMNPPFERFQDINHVYHAYDLLNNGGRMVSIMGEGSFFREDKKARDFREWLGDVGGYSEKLPDGTFRESGTGVSSRIVVISKE